MWEFFVLVAGGVLIAALVIGLGMYLRQERRKRMMAWAEEHGYSFEEKAHELEKNFRKFAPFDSGHSRRVWHVVRGTLEREFVTFQYEFVTGSGKNQQHHSYVVLAMDMPRDGPNLIIKPEHIGHKLFDALGGEDIDFESDEFSRTWWVKCDDRRFAYDAIDTHMMEWLMAQPKRGYQWQGRTLLLHQAGRIEPQKAAAMLAAARGFVAQLPRQIVAA